MTKSMQANLIKKLQKAEHGISFIMGYTTPNKPRKIRIVSDCSAVFKRTYQTKANIKFGNECPCHPQVAVIML